MSHADLKRVLETLGKISRDPSARGLNLEALQTRGNWHSMRVDKGNRLLLWKEGGTYFICEFGRHEDAYGRQRRMQFDPESGGIPLGGGGAVIEVRDDAASQGAELHSLRRQVERLRTQNSIHKGEKKRLQEELEAAEAIMEEAGESAVDPAELDRLRVERDLKQEELEQAQASSRESERELQSALERNREAAERFNELLESETRLRNEKSRLKDEAEELNTTLRGLKDEVEELNTTLRETSVDQWESEVPDSWGEIHDFHRERLDRRLPPFHELERYSRDGEEGSWGVVYHCRDTTTGAYCVVKLPKPCSAEQEEKARSVWAKELRNSRAALNESVSGVARLQKAHDTYLIFEGIQGEVLSDLIDQGEEFHWSEIINIARGVEGILLRLRRADVDFTDLHPGNILIESRNRPTLIDLAECIPRHYCPPEWLSGDFPRIRNSSSGLQNGQTYCLAKLTLKMMLSPQHDLVDPVTSPVSVDSSLEAQFDLEPTSVSTCWRKIEEALRRRFQADPDLRTSAERLSQELVERVFKHALDPDPERRYPTPGEFVDDLDSLHPRH